jgi:hypothetical protein
MKLKSMGRAMNACDEIDRSRALEINEIMRKFEEQQRRLNDLHQTSIRNHDARKTAALARLKQEHDERQAKLLEEIEQQAQRDCEELMKEQQRDEEARHSEDLQSLQRRIDETKARIKLLVAKMDGFVGATGSRMNQIMQLNDVIGEETMDSRREFVLDEAKQMDRILGQLGTDGMHIFDELQSRVSLRSRIEDQHRILAKLDAVAQRKADVLREFADAMTQEVARFEAATRDDYQQSLAQKEQTRAEQEKQLHDLQEEFEGHIAALKKRLVAVTANTSRIVTFYETERAQRLEEVTAYSKAQKEERAGVFKAAHGRRLEKFREKVEQDKEIHQRKMGEIEQEFNERWKDTQNEFDARMAELQDQKLALMKTNKELDEDLKVVLGKRCPECARKRDQIRLIMEKRDQLRERRVALQAEKLDNEEKMNAIFQPATKKTASVVRPPEVLAQSQSWQPKRGRPGTAPNSVTGESVMRTGARTRTPLIHPRLPVQSG